MITHEHLAEPFILLKLHPYEKIVKIFVLKEDKNDNLRKKAWGKKKKQSSSMTWEEKDIPSYKIKDFSLPAGRKEIFLLIKPLRFMKF